jgi:hypothetical protein
MTRVTLGGANSGPRVGPLIISEVMYHPRPPEGRAPIDFEFIEIYNPTDETVDLTGWRVRGTADFDFPDGTELAAGEAAVIVPFDLTDGEKLSAFQEHYGIDLSVKILGGHDDPMDDLGGTVRLERPDAAPPDEPDFTPHLLEDEVAYTNTFPWPTEPGGQGKSLFRRGEVLWGHAPDSWIAADPNPGRFTSQLYPGDANLDGKTNVLDFNIWNAHKFLDGTTWKLGDFDGNGKTDVRDFNIWNEHKFTSVPIPAPVDAALGETDGPSEFGLCGETANELAWVAEEQVRGKPSGGNDYVQAAVDKLLATYWTS